MRTLSLWQPWASLVMAGVKKYETRSWGTAVRGPILIHAGVSRAGIALAGSRGLWDVIPDLLGIHSPEELPYGAVLGAVDLTDCRPTHHPDLFASLDKLENLMGDFSLCRYAFSLDSPVAFPEPLPWVGAQRWFDVPMELPGVLVQPELFSIS